MTMRLPMLDIDDADHSVSRRCNDRHRQKRFVFVFWKSVEDFKSRVFARMPRNGYRLHFLRHPSRDSLSNAHGNLSNQARVRVLGSTQNQVIAGFIQEINQTGITAGTVDDQIYNLPEHLVQIERGTDRLAD